MYYQHIKPLINLLILIILFTRCNDVAGTRDSGTGMGEDSDPSEDYDEDKDDETFCYICRSDYDPHCRNDLDNPSKEFSRICTMEEVKKFADSLRDDPPAHQLPKYDRSIFSYQKNESTTEKQQQQFSCFGLITSDSEFVMRACVLHPDERKDDKGRSMQRKATCERKQDAREHFPKCVVCDDSNCNDKKAGASQISPPTFRALLYVNLLLLLMSGKMAELKILFHL